MLNQPEPCLKFPKDFANQISLYLIQVEFDKNIPYFQINYLEQFSCHESEVHFLYSHLFQNDYAYPTKHKKR